MSTTRSAPPSELHYPPAPPAPALAVGEVHVWAVALDRAAPEADRTLSPDERERAARFRSPVHRRRFAAARHALRTILGSYAGMAARDLRFDYGPYGKPALCGRPFDFNLSHTGDLALLAVTGVGPVGVDVEVVRPSPGLPRLARRVLSPAEREQLFRLPETERAHAFFLAWTRKEALVKMLGEGVFTGLGRLQVTLLPGEPARVVAFDRPGPGREPERWRLHDLRPAPGLAAALAVEAETMPRVRTWRWNEPRLE